MSVGVCSATKEEELTGRRRCRNPAVRRWTSAVPSNWPRIRRCCPWPSFHFGCRSRTRLPIHSAYLPSKRASKLSLHELVTPSVIFWFLRLSCFHWFFFYRTMLMDEEILERFIPLEVVSKSESVRGTYITSESRRKPDRLRTDRLPSSMAPTCTAKTNKQTNRTRTTQCSFWCTDREIREPSTPVWQSRRTESEQLGSNMSDEAIGYNEMTAEQLKAERRSSKRNQKLLINKINRLITEKGSRTRLNTFRELLAELQEQQTNEELKPMTIWQATEELEKCRLDEIHDAEDMEDEVDTNEEPSAFHDATDLEILPPKPSNQGRSHINGQVKVSERGAIRRANSVRFAAHQPENRGPVVRHHHAVKLADVASKKSSQRIFEKEKLSRPEITGEASEQLPAFPDDWLDYEETPKALRRHEENWKQIALLKQHLGPHVCTSLALQLNDPSSILEPYVFSAHGAGIRSSLQRPTWRLYGNLLASNQETWTRCSNSELLLPTLWTASQRPDSSIALNQKANWKAC